MEKNEILFSAKGAKKVVFNRVRGALAIWICYCVHSPSLFWSHSRTRSVLRHKRHRRYDRSYSHDFYFRWGHYFDPRLSNRSFPPRDVYFRSCSYLSFHSRRKKASHWIISFSSSHNLEFVQQVISSLVEASQWPYSWISPPPVTTQGNLKNLIEGCKNQKKATSDELTNAPFYIWCQCWKHGGDNLLKKRQLRRLCESTKNADPVYHVWINNKVFEKLGQEGHGLQQRKWQVSCRFWSPRWFCSQHHSFVWNV